MSKQCSNCRRFMRLIETPTGKRYECQTCRPKEGVLSGAHLDYMDVRNSFAATLGQSRAYTPPDEEEER